MPKPLRLAVLASGRGSNLGALLAAIRAGSCAAEVVGVLSDKAAAPALSLAAEHGIATSTILARDYPDRGAWDAALSMRIAALAPDLVVLAGFMRIVGPDVLGRFPRRIVNVHPSLLPAFPGVDAPQQAIAAGVRISGCTVHLVDAGVDTGPVLAQAAVPVRADDDAATLHLRIQRCEHALLPAVVNAIAMGTLMLDPRPRYTGSDALEQSALVAPPLLTDSAR